MNDTVRDWIAKAHGDARTASREAAVESEPNYDAVCFHAQQCVEKLMKAVLIDGGTTPPRTHDLTYLSTLIAEREPSWSWNRAELRYLSAAAVGFRYPGEAADREDAIQALDICDRIRPALESLIRPSTS